MEIYCALLPKLDAGADSAERLIIEFLANQRDKPILACSGCAGDYENPDATAPPDIHSQHEEAVSPSACGKNLPGSKDEVSGG